MQTTMKSVFISYLSEQHALADRLRILLNNAFSGDIQFFLAPQRIINGDDWREQIKTLLKSSDAGLFLITPQFLAKRDWLIAEYICFWLFDKPRFLFTLDAIKESDLPSPIGTQLQVTSLTDCEGLKRFFEKISQDLLGKNISDGTYEPPYQKAASISDICVGLYKEYVDKITGVDPNVLYKFVSEKIHWRFTLNTIKKHLDGLCTRSIVVASYKQKVDYIPINFRSTEGFDYLNFKPKIEHTRGYGTVRPRAEPKKDRFLLEFIPALGENETVEITTIEYSIPAYKFATKQSQLEQLIKNNFTLQEIARKEHQGSEQIIVGINTPTDNIEYEIRFPQDYPVSYVKTVPFHDSSTDANEMVFIEENRCTKQFFDKDTREYVYQFTRKQPRYLERYNISWEIPSEDELV